MLTSKEIIFFQACKASGFLELDIDTSYPIWCDVISSPELKGKALSGVFSSLERKGLLQTDGETFVIMSEGIKEMRAAKII